jgi:hypothetical protein
VVIKSIAVFLAALAALAVCPAFGQGPSQLPMADIAMDEMPKSYPRPVSAWRASEKDLYRSMLRQARFDTLVLPFQVEGHAFSRGLRSFMGAHLAMAMADAGGGRIADPYIAGRALGDGGRRFDVEEVFGLANLVGAKRIVAGYVGHDEKNRMHITLYSYERGDRAGFFKEPPGVPSGPVKSRHFENIAYSSEVTPIDGYLGALPGMLEFLGLEPAAIEPKVSRFDGSLPPSPASLGGESTEPARDAYLLQLLANLAPQSADHEHDRLMQKSLLAVLRMSPKSPDYRVLKARALMGLGLRPAAIKVLGTPATAEQQYVRAFLDGNLPVMRSVRAKVPAGAKSLLALLEESKVAAAYSGDDATKRALSEAKALKLPGATWRYLVRRALADPDLWQQFENIELKVLLDREMPLAGYTVKSIAGGMGVVGDLGKFSTVAQTSALDHLRKHMAANASQWCCEPLRAGPAKTDFADLVLGISTDNLARRAKFLHWHQGQPAEAAQWVAGLNAIYKDHPVLTLARAQAQQDMVVRAQGAEREALAHSAYVDAVHVWYWEQGQTLAAARAVEIVRGLNRTDFGFFIHNIYRYDYPYRPDYSYWGDMQDPLPVARAALENSAYDIYPVTSIESALRESGRWPELDQFVASLGDRFSGEPVLTKIMAQSAARTGDIAKAEKYYREGIRGEPGAAWLYSELGKLLFEAGRDDSSATLFMSYPGLSMKAGENSVGVANFAYEAGSYFWWQGDFERAVPFYRVAAKLNTGSASSIASATRLALFEKDYLAAARGSIERGTRYQSTYAYRDYLALLHTMGHPKETWEGFAALVQGLDQPHVWESAFVGQRREGKSLAQMAVWAREEPFRNAGGVFAYAPMHLLRAGVTDRAPDAQLPKLIAEIERPVWKVTVPSLPPAVARQSADARLVVLGPHGAGAAFGLPANPGTRQERVKSDLLFYAEAYAAIRAGKFGDAHAMLAQAAELYDMTHVSLGYLLPTLAYAAARAKDTSALERRLDDFPPEAQRFDYQLARAVIAALVGKHDMAVASLNLALHRRPFTEFRPIFTEYQYAEICEWLFDATGDARYRVAALDWAKKNQVLQPWMAWAYAVEAKFATDPAERSRAIGMAHYLDPNSERLASLPKAEVEKAAKAFASINPLRNATGPKQPI